MLNLAQHLRSVQLLLRRQMRFVAYIFGLIVLALYVTGNHCFISRQLNAQHQIDTLTTLSKQQSLLIAQISQLSYRHLLSDGTHDPSPLQDRLMHAVEQMRENQRQLQHYTLAAPSTPSGDEPPRSIVAELDEDLRLFLTHAEHLAHHQAPVSGQETHPHLNPALSDRLHQHFEQVQQDLQATSHATQSRLHIFRQVLYASIMLLLLLKGLLVTRLIFKPLMRQVDKYRVQAHMDPLTECFNRRSFLQAMAEELRLVWNGKHECSLLLMDIDHFKRINDNYGHAMGDQVLRTVARTCSAHLRSSDIFGRLGGEEFGVLLRNTSLADARQVAENLRERWEAMTVMTGTPESEALTLTVSIGVTSIQPGDSSPLDALERADDALYQAKNKGRNQVVLYSARSDESSPISTPTSSAIC